MTQTVKNPPAMQETWVQSLGQEDPLEEEMPTLSSILSCLENPMKRGACPWGHKESDTTEQLTHTHTKDQVRTVWKSDLLFLFFAWEGFYAWEQRGEYGSRLTSHQKQWRPKAPEWHTRNAEIKHIIKQEFSI